MRAAFLTSAAIFAMGAYLMIASTFALSPGAIVVGVLVITVTTAITLVTTGKRSALSR
jgi:hypothetical protein